MQATDRNKISVIVTVLNDAEGITALLDALVGQTRPPDEIVIVDGGSSDGTMAAIEAFDGGDITIRALSKPGVNIAAGRNLAITEASHDIIACADAGCVPDITWLEELVAPFADPEITVVGGNYRIAARTALERVVGMLTMPGELIPIEPTKFNPSARSLAFRRDAWSRAGGFPDWLMTAEDTLFACKLRQNRETFAYAEFAVVRWRPRQTIGGVWRQFRNYARGEAHIGRGEDTVRYWKRRYIIGGLAALLCAVGGWLVSPIAIGAGAAALAASLVAPIHRRATAVVRRTSRWFDYPRALVLHHVVALAGIRGFAMGRRDRERDPHGYIGRLNAYWGAPALGAVAPWKMLRAPTPRTLILSWHWPPTNRASTNVLANLFKAAPPGVFTAITRDMPAGDDPVDVPNIPTHRVRWSLADERDGTIANWFASIIATFRIFLAARKLHRETPFQRILAIYPHRYSLLAGTLASRWLHVPLAAYMHDLCAEALITRNPFKRVFWTKVDARALSSAFLVATPTREFATHYRSRNVMESWVLPHCNPKDAAPEDHGERSNTLRLLYAGNVYQAHEDAVAALLSAADMLDNVQLEFLSGPHKLIPPDRTHWVDRATARSAMAEADVLVVALSNNTPYPREVQGCFPSKIVDYLLAGKPILAIVPPGSFVDRFVRSTGCGVVVTSQAAMDIARVVNLLRDASARRDMAAASRRVSKELDAARWMQHFCERLALGATIDPSTPPFPEVKPAADLLESVSSRETTD
ncbi:MAG: glycosyltransferase [Phycisphaerales bacterium]|nr:glycosyltransferase [Phycisphaerales bacterium]